MIKKKEFESVSAIKNFFSLWIWCIRTFFKLNFRSNLILMLYTPDQMNSSYSEMFSAVSLTTFLSLLAQGFWARANPVSKSCDSLKPPNIFLWKVSFCHVLIRSPSSDTRERQMEECRVERRSAEERKHCHARNREPYRGPAHRNADRDLHETLTNLFSFKLFSNSKWTWPVCSSSVALHLSTCNLNLRVRECF